MPRRCRVSALKGFVSYPVVMFKFICGLPTPIEVLVWFTVFVGWVAFLFYYFKHRGVAILSISGNTKFQKKE